MFKVFIWGSISLSLESEILLHGDWGQSSLNHFLWLYSLCQTLSIRNTEDRFSYDASFADLCIKTIADHYFSEILTFVFANPSNNLALRYIYCYGMPQKKIYSNVDQLANLYSVILR